MERKTFCLNILRNYSDYIKDNFGVKSMMLFGSVARGESHPDSDVDLYVEMPPKVFKIMDLEDFLIQLLGSKIDIIRKRKNINIFLLSEIEKDGILIF